METGLLWATVRDCCSMGESVGRHRGAAMRPMSEILYW